MFDAGLLQHLLEELEIADKIRDSTRLVDMSGGEKQRLCLARSLSVRPSILLLDEPCTGLDPFKKLSFLKKLRTLVDEYQILAVYVTHHANEVRLICDDVALMRSCPDGTTEISRQRVSEFLQKPPSPEATQILLPELLNQLFCIRRRECFYLVGSDEMVAQASERAGDDTTCTVLFDPTALLASRDGFRCEIVSASDVFRFVKPVAQPQSLLVSAGAVGTDRAMVRGTALVFPDNSRFGYRTELI
jgi:ABC-type sulfate/molybdate transport systems ATPase subunit